MVCLQDGVLSYFKIHGPDKIVVNQGTEKGSKVIGEESSLGPFFSTALLLFFWLLFLFSFLFLNLLAKIYVYFRNFSVSIIHIQFLFEFLSFFPF